MATAYTSLLGLALPVTGELSGTWGATVNDEITALLDSAVAGTTSITADADITLSDTDGAANETRQAIILWNPATGTTTRNITAPARSKAYIVINASGGTQSIVLRGAGPTTGVTIVKGEEALCAWDGSDFVKVANQNGAGAFTTLTASTNINSTRINPRTSTVADTATLTPDISTHDQFNLTAQAQALTVAAPIGTPVDGNKIIFRILDNGTARAITWNATYTVIGTTLPTTTIINKMIYVGCIYNSTNTRWDVVAVTTQA